MLAGERPATRRPGLLSQLALVALLFVGYDRVADLADVRVGGAVERGRALLDLERSLGLAVELPLDRALAGHAQWGRVLALYYDLAHVSVTAAVLGALYLTRPGAYRTLRSSLVAINLVGLAVFLVAPVAPPRLLPGGGFADVVALSGTWGSSAVGSALATHADQYGSMPSLHVAWACWVLLAARAGRARPLWRRLALAHLAATVVVVLATGNHYLIDVAAGGALAVGCTPRPWRAVRRVGRPAVRA